MHELRTELERFTAGSIDLAQLRSSFGDYFARHPNEREPVASWLKASIRYGRLPSSIWDSLSDLFDSSGVASHDGSLLIRTRTQQVGSVGTQETNVGLKPSPQRTAAGPLRPGMVVKERFILVELLGSGGMGQVFKARDVRREEAQDRNPFVALKALNSEFSAHPDSFMALQREARRAGTLAHPNVVTVYDFDRDGARIYMTMEYLEGAVLDWYLRGEWSSGLPMEKAWPVIHAIAQALEYGHQKRIVHSDLKPGNIFICSDGTVKVLDFGIARLIRPADGKGEETIFDPSVRFGGLTPAYASLELWSGEAPDPRDDIYAFACVTYELLSGRHPFARASAKDCLARKLTPQRIDGLTRVQWEVLRRGLALHREQRVSTVREFVKPFEPQPPLRRHALAVGIATLCVAVVATALGARYYRDAVRGSALRDVECAQLPKPVVPIGRGAPLTDEQRLDIDAKLTLAHDYMRDITPHTSFENFKSILTEGPNSVEYVVNNILDIDPAQKDALQLKAEIVAAYSAKADDAVRQDRPGEALELVEHARRVQPDSESLCRLEQSIRREQLAGDAQTKQASQ
jgi:hypothetical protein